jgi:nicotinamide riboside kinase
MTEPLIIMFSGVENSGKSTLSKVMSEILGWELIPEMSRQDVEVLRVEETPSTLIKLHHLQEAMALEAYEKATEGVLCDTGALELEMWSRGKFNEEIELETTLPISLIILCETIPIWEVDPIRQIPLFEDRKALEAVFYKAHKSSNIPFIVLPPVSLEDRIALVMQEISSISND